MSRFSEQHPIRVLIVDDSALMRQLLSAVLSSDPEIVVVDTASDPLIAREKIKQHNPHVVTLDIEMPRMNGLDFLQKVMTLRPTPVVMISSLTQEGADATLKALEMGAVDFIGKPAGFVGDGIDDLRGEILAKVKAAAESHIPSPARPVVSLRRIQDHASNNRVIAIGASTGGVPAIMTILAAMPANAPPIVIAQHMPANFTDRFAARLDTTCSIKVVEARDGEVLAPGHAYIAPGGNMLRVKTNASGHVLRLTDEPRFNGFCPSIDVLFESVAGAFGDRAIGVLLTGMGHDGARGLLKLRQSGANTIGQDQASCVVYGMPRVAFLLGAVQRQLPLSRIPAELLTLCAHSVPVAG